jgi:hypothetical protein
MNIEGSLRKTLAVKENDMSVPVNFQTCQNELLRGTNSKINVCFVFFPSVECLLHCKVIIRYRNIVIITFCGYLLANTGMLRGALED